VRRLSGIKTIKRSGGDGGRAQQSTDRSFHQQRKAGETEWLSAMDMSWEAVIGWNPRALGTASKILRRLTNFGDPAQQPHRIPVVLGLPGPIAGLIRRCSRVCGGRRLWPKSAWPDSTLAAKQYSIPDCPELQISQFDQRIAEKRLISGMAEREDTYLKTTASRGCT